MAPSQPRRMSLTHTGRATGSCPKRRGRRSKRLAAGQRQQSTKAAICLLLTLLLHPPREENVFTLYKMGRVKQLYVRSHARSRSTYRSPLLQ
jgi:hypothetical protein